MNMTDDQKVAYLANVIAVSRIDRSVSASESQIIEADAKRIGANKSAVKKAEALAQSNEFTPAPVGSFATRIANLEDMLRVSLVDGVLDQAEKSLLLGFAKNVGITNYQLQLVFREVRNSLASTEKTRYCPNCSATASLDARFCPACGGALAVSSSESATAVEYAIPAVGVAIEFAESTAGGFLDAVRKMKEAPESAECLKGKKTWYMAAWPVERIAEAAKLVEHLKGMRNRKVWVNGTESSWDEVFGFSWCAEQRNTAYRPLEYCFGVTEKRLNLWGCKNARMDWMRWSDWFSYGAFAKPSTLSSGHSFIFDKKRIRHELETNLFRYRFCPHLSFRLLESVLNQLPDQVTVTANGDWQYKEDYAESPGAIKVTERVVQGDYAFTKEFYSSGVAPRTTAIGLQILERAFHATGADPTVLRELLSYKDEARA